MGADIFRGRDIALQSSMTADGKEYFELVPVDGGDENASYSTIAAAVSLCQERGVPADTWPIYYGVYDADVPIEEVRKRCESLRLALVKTGKRGYGPEPVASESTEMACCGRDLLRCGMNIRLGRREIKKDRLDGQRSCNFGRESQAGRLATYRSPACARTEFGLSLAEAKAITDTTDGKPPLFPPVGDAKQLTAVLASELGYCGCAFGQLSRFSEHCFRPFRSELTRPAMELRFSPASRRLEASLETGGGWAEWLVYGWSSGKSSSCSTVSDSPTCSSRRGGAFCFRLSSRLDPA